MQKSYPLVRGKWGAGQFGGQLVAQYRGTATGFVIKDHLGSARLDTLTPYSGSQSVYDNMDFLPFGEQIAGGSATSHKFTGDERDYETNLDHTDFRQYSSQLGRWMSPDPENAGASPNSPQSWNAYSYVSNDPLNFTDPDGLCGGPPGSVSFTVDTTSTTDIFSPPCIDGASFSWRVFLQEAGNAAQKANDYLHAAYQAVVNSRASCVAAYTASGALAGSAAGAGTFGAAGAGGGAAVGLAGGPAAPVTVPLGAGAGGGAGAIVGGIVGGIGGGGLGYATGQALCSAGTGSGGGGGGRASGSSARLTKPQQRQTAEYLGMKEVKGMTSQGQTVFEINGRYFSFSNTSHTANEVFKELDRNGNRIATTDLNLNRIGP